MRLSYRGQQLYRTSQLPFFLLFLNVFVDSYDEHLHPIPHLCAKEQERLGTSRINRRNGADGDCDPTGDSDIWPNWIPYGVGVARPNNQRTSYGEI